MIRLAQSGDGRIMIANNQEFPSDIRRVEYYRDMRLVMLVYEDEEHGSELMPLEVSEEDAVKIIKSPDVVIIALTKTHAEPMGYIVPLVQIGV